ncbi:MAG: hypothetical protein Q4E34_03135 [Synergistaceae bacterium]|nr:hypothetical protein [Synergistaceae bacterium]
MDKHMEKLSKTETWQEAYDVAMELYQCMNEDTEEAVIEGLRKSLRTGLDIDSDAQRFFEATKITARLYFLRGEYQKASRQLQLYKNQKDCPIWVNNYRALINLRTDNFRNVLEDPVVYFFNYIDNADVMDSTEIGQRNVIFCEFLDRLSQAHENGQNIQNIDEGAILNRAVSYGLSDNESVVKYRNTFCPNYVLDNLIDGVSASKQSNKMPNIDKHGAEDEYIQELCAEKQKAQESEDAKNKEIKRLEREIERLRNEKDQKIREQDQKIKEKDRKIQELEKQKKEANILHNNEIQKIVSETRDTECRDASADDMSISGDELLACYPNMKILVYGYNGCAKKRDLLEAAKSWHFKEKDFVFQMDGKKNKQIDFKQKKWAAIMAAPCMHSSRSVSDTNKHSTLEALRQAAPNKDMFFEMRTASGKLKITVENFKDTLDKIYKELLKMWNDK